MSQRGAVAIKRGPRHSKKRDRKRASPSILLVGRLIVVMLSLASAPIVARAIGTAGRGETAAAIAVFLILPIILAFGFPLELRRITAQGAHESALRSARIWCIVGFIPSCGCAVALYFTLFSSFDSASRIVATVGVVSCPLAASWICDNGVLLGQDRYGSVFILLVSQPLIYVSLVLIFWVSDSSSVATVLLSNMAGVFAAFVLGLGLTKNKIFGPVYPPMQLFRSAVRFAGSAIADVTSNRVDQVVALPLMGAHQAGLYSIAATVATAPIALGQALGASYFGASAKSTAADRRELASESMRVAFVASFATIPIYGLVVAFAIPVVFGPAFEDSVAPAVICLIASIAGVVSYVVSMVLAAAGRGWSMTGAQTIGLAVGMLALLILGPPLGAIGGAISAVCSATVILVGLSIAARPVVRSLLFRARDLRTALTRLTKPLAVGNVDD